MVAEQIPTSIAAILGTLVVGLLAVIVLLVKTMSEVKTGSQQAAAVNDAVNNIGPGGVRLYDRVSHIDQAVAELRQAQTDFAKRGWGALPDDIATASGLTEVIRDIQHEIADISTRLRVHDEWERSIK